MKTITIILSIALVLVGIHDYTATSHYLQVSEDLKNSKIELLQSEQQLKQYVEKYQDALITIEVIKSKEEDNLNAEIKKNSSQLSKMRTATEMLEYCNSRWEFCLKNH